MTVSYQYSVATASLVVFPRLLARWKGSIYKLVLTEGAIYATLYLMISALYLYLLDEAGKK